MRIRVTMRRLLRCGLAGFMLCFLYLNYFHPGFIGVEEMYSRGNPVSYIRRGLAKYAESLEVNITNTNQEEGDKQTSLTSYTFRSKGHMEHNILEGVGPKGSEESFSPQCPIPLQKVRKISCERIMTGDPYYLSSVYAYPRKRTTTHCNWASLMSNCSYLKHNHGYHGKVVTPEELNFPLAFGMKVHKDPIQAEQLLRTIYRPHNVYCIHVDMKAGKGVTEPFRKISECFDNVFVIQKYRVVYSSIRQPLSDIECMKVALESGVAWKYYLILAGQEFPLKTNLEMVQLFKSLNGTNDIESYPYPKREAKRFQMRHVLVNDHFEKKVIPNKPPFKHNITIYKGCSYGSMTRDFVKFVLTDSISKDLLIWAEDIYAPEELIWATLNALPGAPGGYKNSVKMIDHGFLSRTTIWLAYKRTCKGKYVRGICIFSYMDLSYLVSTPELIANKFHSDYDQLVLDCLEEWVNHKVKVGRTLNMNWFHYRNAPHMNKSV